MTGDLRSVGSHAIGSGIGQANLKGSSPPSKWQTKDEWSETVSWSTSQRLNRLISSLDRNMKSRLVFPRQVAWGRTPVRLARMSWQSWKPNRCMAATTGREQRSWFQSPAKKRGPGSWLTLSSANSSSWLVTSLPWVWVPPVGVP